MPLVQTANAVWQLRRISLPPCVRGTGLLPPTLGRARKGLGLSQSTWRWQRELGEGRADGFACKQQYSKLTSLSDNTTVVLETAEQLSNTARDLADDEPCWRNCSLNVSPVPYLASRVAVLERFWHGFSNTLWRPGPLASSRQPCAVGSSKPSKGQRWIFCCCRAVGCSVRSPPLVPWLSLEDEGDSVLGNTENPKWKRDCLNIALGWAQQTPACGH